MSALHEDGPNELERGYEARGYRLPDGWTWPEVRATREVLRFEDHHVPMAVGERAMVWGRPQRREHAQIDPARVMRLRPIVIATLLSALIFLPILIVTLAL